MVGSGGSSSESSGGIRISPSQHRQVLISVFLRWCVNRRDCHHLDDVRSLNVWARRGGQRFKAFTSFATSRRPQRRRVVTMIGICSSGAQEQFINETKVEDRSDGSRIPCVPRLRSRSFRHRLRLPYTRNCPLPKSRQHFGLTIAACAKGRCTQHRSATPRQLTDLSLRVPTTLV